MSHRSNRPSIAPAKSAGRAGPSLASLAGRHAGKTCLVCGCGASISELPETLPAELVTIGVNDIGRKFDPDYLVVVNGRSQFNGDRFHYVEKSKCDCLVTQLDLEIRHPNQVQFKLGIRGGTDFSDPNVLHFTNNSPYVALCLAIHLGAKRIGLIGVDFTDHHFFAKSGSHPLSTGLKRIDEEYGRLRIACERKAVEIVNLSRESRLTAFVKVPLFEFMKKVPPHANIVPTSTGLEIVSYATSPVAGVPAVLARCLDSQTVHRSRSVWAKSGYGNGVTFTGDIEYATSPATAEEALAKADVVIVHNGKVYEKHRRLIEEKAIITMAHNYGWNVDFRYVDRGMPGAVVGQYQATLPEFRNWQIVPNPMPLWEPDYEPGAKQNRISIAYTPSGRHERYPVGHRLYWHAKGYQTTMAVLDKLARSFPVDLLVIRHRQVSHGDSLAMKRAAHIVIDECVTGSYHRNSLEGLATGCVVVNGMHLREEVGDVFSRCAGVSAEEVPFCFADLESLEGVLQSLIQCGAKALADRGAKNAAWMRAHWDFAFQWKLFWEPLIERALEKRLRSEPRDRGRRVAASKGRVLRQTRPEAEIVAAGIPEVSVAKHVPAYWTGRSPRANFGDALTPLIVKALSGLRVRFEAKKPKLFAVGSLLKFAKRGDLVWGSGFISDQDRCETGVNIRAVRGPLTRQCLLDQGIECPEVFGDPAILLPSLYAWNARAHWKIGIVPHYADYALVQRSIKDPAIRIIRVRAPAEEVVRAILQCEVIFSSSLHGCIVAEAYGIPAAWVRITDAVIGDGFKFRDYYQATERDPICVDWRKGISIGAAEKAALSSKKPEIDPRPLLESFPFDRAGKLLVSKDEMQSECSRSVTAAVKQSNHLQKKSRIAIFGVATEDCVPYMITSLRSIAEHNEGKPFDYFILGSRLSGRSRSLARHFGIEFIDIDLKKTFFRRPDDRYPSECFWIFKAPELFGDAGYGYSLGIDHDIWCNCPLDLEWVPRIRHVAGIDRGCTVRQFLTSLGQYSLLERHFRISEKGADRVATHTGVLFFNNKALSQLGFFGLAARVYGESEAIGVRRRGDDSTMALMMAIDPDLGLHVLERSWNSYSALHGSGEIAWHSSFPAAESIRFGHFVRPKPWSGAKTFPHPELGEMARKWRMLWQDTAKAIPAAREDDSNEPGRRGLRNNARSGRGRGPFDVLCYRYRGSVPNFGDETGPYLIRKIAELRPEEAMRPSPRDPSHCDELVLLSVGSVLRLCRKNTIVWGAGIRNIDQAVQDAWRFCAVRGPITRRRLCELGYDCPEVYGDPALLLPKYYRPKTSKRFRVGVVPHHLDFPEISKWFRGIPHVTVINSASSDPERVVSRMLECKATISTSLHGLVASVAYGIPTRWMKISNRIMGDDCKFYDFFASLDRRVMESLDPRSVTLPENESALECYRPIRMTEELLSSEALAAQACSLSLTVDLDRLLAACPIDKNGWKPEFRFAQSGAGVRRRICH